MPDYPMGIQYDEQGRPFSYVGGTSRRSYISPVAFGGQAPEDTTGIFRQAPQWNNNTGNWETPIDWGNIMNIGVGSLLTAGALDAFLPAGAPATLPSGPSTLPSSPLPSLGPMPGAPGVLPSSPLPSLGPMPGGLPSVAPLPNAAPLPRGLPGLPGQPGNNWINDALRLAAPVALTTIGRRDGGGGGNNQIPIPPELTQLLQEATRRSMNQSGLSDAITAQALAGLPNYARG